MSANGWIRKFLPNFENSSIEVPPISERRSLLQKLCELIIDLGDGHGKLISRFDKYLMRKWEQIWKYRYPKLTDEQRDLMFRCRPYTSKAHPGDFQTFVLREYESRLRKFGISAYD
jgi:hypothetical protein